MSFPYLCDVIQALTGYDLPLPLPMFGLLVACAALAAAACLKAELGRMAQDQRIGNAKRPLKGPDGTPGWVAVPPQEIVADLTVAVMLAGIVGARLFHILEHWDSFVANPWPMIFSRSGLSVFGSLIFGAITGLVLVKRWQLAARPFFDAIAPADVGLRDRPHRLPDRRRRRLGQCLGHVLETGLDPDLAVGANL